MAAQMKLSFNATLQRPHRAPRVHIELVRESEPRERIVLRTSADIYALLRDEAAAWDRERFVTIMLDQKHALIAIEEVSVGSLCSAIVHPREVFKGLILSNAAAFAICHNHPSGDPTPSQEDIAITRRLREAADLLGIRFLDHIVIGAGCFISFAEAGYW